MKECEAFLTRARSHSAELDSKRATVMENIEASEKRLSEQRSKLQAPPPQQKSQKCSNCEDWCPNCRPKSSRCGVPVWTSTSRIRSVPVGERISFHSATEEFQEWMEGRRKDLQTAVETGQLLGSGEDLAVAHASSVGVAAKDPRPSYRTPVSSGQYCAMIRHRCGMLGVRVGEASN